MPKRQNATAQSSLTCSDDMQTPSTPTFTMYWFLVRAFSNPWIVRAGDDGTCYDFARVDRGSPIHFGCIRVNVQSELTSRAGDVNRDCALTRMHPKQKHPPPRTSPHRKGLPPVWLTSNL
jgi:hypothetical protein